MVRHSPLALAVLAMLTEAPMHPYRMQQLIKARGKDEVINVGQRNSLYQTIDRLVRGDLIAIRETERDGAFPERTVYEITEAGRDTARLWLREQLAPTPPGISRLFRPRSPFCRCFRPTTPVVSSRPASAHSNGN
jgi:DNA-binding PadR family transcriptional regulator